MYTVVPKWDLPGINSPTYQKAPKTAIESWSFRQFWLAHLPTKASKASQKQEKIEMQITHREQ